MPFAYLGLLLAEKDFVHRHQRVWRAAKLFVFKIALPQPFFPSEAFFFPLVKGFDVARVKDGKI